MKVIRALALMAVAVLASRQAAIAADCSSCDAPTVTLRFKLQGWLAGSVATTLKAGEQVTNHLLTGGSVQLYEASGRYVVQSFGCGEWSASQAVTVHLDAPIEWAWTWVTDDADPAYTELDPGASPPLLMNVSLPEAPCLRFFVQLPGSSEFVPYEGGIVTAPPTSSPQQTWRFKVETGAPEAKGTLAAANPESPLGAGLTKEEPRNLKFHNSGDLGPLCGTMPSGASLWGEEGSTDAAHAGSRSRIIPEGALTTDRATIGAGALRARHRFDRAGRSGVDNARLAGGGAKRMLEIATGGASVGAVQMEEIGVIEESVVPTSVEKGGAVRVPPIDAGAEVAGGETLGVLEPASSPPPGVSPGEFLAKSVGALHMELALGTGLGSLIYETPAIDADAYSPARLQFDSAADPLGLYSDAEGAIRQALFPTGLLDIVTIDGSRFEVRFFAPDQFHDSGGGFSIDDDNPRQRWLIENPDPTPVGRVRFVGTRDGATQVHLATWEAPGPADDGRMILSLFNDSVIEERTYLLDTASAAATRSERVTRRRGVAGDVEEDRLTVYGEFYHWGEEGEVFEAVVSEIEDPDGAALATYYGYYDQPTQPGGNLAWVIHPDGYWEAYNRYQTTGDLAQTFRPWIDDPADPFAANTSNSLVTTVTYQYPQPNIELKIEDTIWKNSVRIGYRIRTTTLQPDGSIVVTTETFLSATSSTLSEMVKASWQGPLLGAYEARGTLRTLNRTWGYWDPAGRTFWFSPGPGRVVAERAIETEGTLGQPGGVANETAIDVRYADDRGRVLLEETYVNDGNPFVPGMRTDWISQRAHTYNPAGQIVASSQNGRVVFEAGYDVDGRLEWSIDELGIRTEFEYDSLGRVFRTIRIAGPSAPDRTTTFEFDSAGRVVSQTVEAGSGTDARLETTEYRYDLAGRLIRTIAPNGLELTELESMLIGADGAPQRRQVVTTNPDGSQEIVEFYRDRRLFRRYGSAVPAEFWGYGVNGYGRVSASFRDLAATQLREQRITDWAGNTVFDVLPGFTGQGFHVVSNTYGGAGPLGTVRGLLVARSVPGRAIERFEHDTRGRVVASGLDLDASGVLERTGADPISLFGVVFENAGSGWSRVDRITRLETDGSAVEALVSERREKVGALGGALVASVETREPGGARTRTEIAADRVAATRETSVRDLAADGSTPPAIATEIGGLLRTVRTPEAATDTVYSYDALGRVTSVQNPLSGAMTYAYDALGRLESTTDNLLRETRLTYHPQGQPGAGRVATTRDPAGNTTFFAYNSRGGLWRQWGVNIYPQEFGYNDDNQLTSLRTYRTVDPPAPGGVDWSSATWPANAPAGDQTQWIYDPSGLLSRKRYADGTEVVYGYDAARRVASRTNARGQTITHSFNDLGQPAATTYPAGSQTSDCVFGYDRAGRVKSITDASGTREMEFDPETGGTTGEFYTEGLLAGLSVNRSFDEFGRQDSLDVPSVFALGWEYDPLNRLERITGASGTAAGLEATYVREAGSDRLQNIEWKHGETLRLQSTRIYDSVSRLTQVTTLDGQGIVRQSHGYSAFDALDRRKRVERENGRAWDYDYDTRGQLTGAVMRDSSGAALPGHEFTFSFDAIGNRTGAAQGTLASIYAANELNQYLERTVPGVIRVVGTAAADTYVTADFRAAARLGEWFAVDIPVNNSAVPVWKEFDVVAVRSSAGPGGEDDVASVARSAFVAKTPEDFAHDADGNLTADGRWTYMWDAENRLIAMETREDVVAPTGPVPEGERKRLEFVYDCQSRRIAKKVFIWSGMDWALASHGLYLYDGWNVIAEFDALSGQSLARTYVWGLDLSGSAQGAGGVGGLVAVIDSNGVHAPWWDGNGNVTGYSNLETGTEEARFTFGPFGETLAATGPLADTFTHRFSTKFTDPESGLLYYGFRYYSPSTGRWLSRDPVGERGGNNRYRGLSNTPNNKYDVLGLYEEAGHFWTTYLVARAAGRSQQAAFQLAYYSQLADEFSPYDALNAGLAFSRLVPNARQSIQSYRGRVDARYLRRIQELLHSLHGGRGDATVGAWRTCLEGLIRSGTLKTWEEGFVIHALGDAFAHTYTEPDGIVVNGPNGSVQWISNPLAGQESAYSYPFGHAEDSKFGKDPDAIATAPEKFRKYANHLFDSLGGSDRSSLERFLSVVAQIPTESEAANDFVRSYVSANTDYNDAAERFGWKPASIYEWPVIYNPNRGKNLIENSAMPLPTPSDLEALLAKLECCAIRK